MPEFHFRYSDNDRKEIKMSTVVEAAKRSHQRCCRQQQYVSTMVGVQLKWGGNIVTHVQEYRNLQRLAFLGHKFLSSKTRDQPNHHLHFQFNQIVKNIHLSSSSLVFCHDVVRSESSTINSMVSPQSLPRNNHSSTLISTCKIQELYPARVIF